MKNDQMQRGTDGTGSAEQTGRDRSEQQMNPPGKQEIGNAIGEDSSRIASLDELGANSGREDASGGSGDRMEGEDSGSETDR
jgi:hypothetical protein